MVNSSERLIVHSLTEASLCLMLAPCGACSGSVLPHVGEAGETDGGRGLIVPVVCRSCGWSGEVQFDLARVAPAERVGGLHAWAAVAELAEAPPVNRTDEPSEAIDVAGWIRLYTRLSEMARVRGDRADSPADRSIARQLYIQAGECLDEALKFYESDNLLPPQAAFFTEAGVQQFREKPEQFLRDALLSQRTKMPYVRGTE